MRKILSMALLVLATALFVGCASTKSIQKTDAGKFQYELEGVGNATQGAYLVKVWTYSPTKHANIEECKKNAVHGVIFKGYAASGQVRAQQPLVREAGAQMTHADYFNQFFADGGEYNRYVTVTQGSQEVLRVGKTYKIGLVVSVSKDQLRKALESAGVVKPLNYGF